MSVTVFFNGPIKKATGMLKIEVEADTVEELIEELSKRFGWKFKEEIRKTKIIVNGYPVQFAHSLSTALKDGDIVNFLQNWRLEEKRGGDKQ